MVQLVSSRYRHLLRVEVMAGITWPRLRRLAGLNQGTWVARGETIERPDPENRAPDFIARCDSLQTAEYIVGLHEWILKLANALLILSKRLEDNRKAGLDV